MGLLSHIISVLSIAAGTANVQRSGLIWTDEPVCPKELL